MKPKVIGFYWTLTGRVGKAQRIEKARGRALELRAQAMSVSAAAAALNLEGIKTATGKDWTAENIVKLLR